MVFFFLGAAAAQEKKPCTEADFLGADDSLYHLNGWEEIYSAFKMFGHCDDGYIAEGYSEAVVRRITDKWGDIDSLIIITSFDSGFRAFVLSHIDATAANEIDVEKILNNCRRRCPKNAEGLCKDIEVAAKKALLDIAGVRRGKQ